jgi:hypothetical protein
MKWRPPIEDPEVALDAVEEWLTGEDLTRDEAIEWFIVLEEVGSLLAVQRTHVATLTARLEEAAVRIGRDVMDLSVYNRIRDSKAD